MAVRARSAAKPKPLVETPERITLRNRQPIDLKHLDALGQVGTERALRKFFLYRMWDAEGTLLYIGLTTGLKRRISTPKHYAEWFSEVARVEQEPIPAGVEAFLVETAAIKAEQPKYNRNRGSERYERQMAAAAQQARTARREALVSDADRLEAARLAAERLTDWLKVEQQPSWSTYHDSVGGVISVRS